MRNFFNSVKNILRMLLICITIGYGATVTYWLLYPYNVIDVDYIKIMNPNKTVKQGGTLIYEISYTKYMDINGVVSRRLINTYTISYSDMAGISPPGSRITHTHLPIPVYASPGKYHLIWTVRHPVNPMRSVSETTWSDEFTIEAKNDDGRSIKEDNQQESDLIAPMKPSSKKQETTFLMNSFAETTPHDKLKTQDIER